MSIESELAYLKSGEYKTHMEQILSGCEKEEAQDKHCHYGKACRAIKGLLKDQGIDADSHHGVRTLNKCKTCNNPCCPVCEQLNECDNVSHRPTTASKGAAGKGDVSPALLAAGGAIGPTGTPTTSPLSVHTNTCAVGILVLVDQIQHQKLKNGDKSG